MCRPAEWKGSPPMVMNQARHSNQNQIFKQSVLGRRYVYSPTVIVHPAQYHIVGFIQVRMTVVLRPAVTQNGVLVKNSVMNGKLSSLWADRLPAAIRYGDQSCPAWSITSSFKISRSL